MLQALGFGPAGGSVQDPHGGGPGNVPPEGDPFVEMGHEEDSASGRGQDGGNARGAQAIRVRLQHRGTFRPGEAA